MADIKLAYGTITNLTLTLASLASDANLIAGRASTAVDNSSDLFMDVLITGMITTGTSPTTDKSIFVYAYAAIDYGSPPTYPASFGGSDANLSISVVQREAAYRLIAAIRVDSNSDKTYWIAPTSLAALFGGVMPPSWGVFVVHNTAVNLNSTGSNHQITYIPVYSTVS